MADEELSADQPELETPASPAQEQAAETPTEEEAADGLDTEEAGSDGADEFDDYELDGKSYKVPKAIVPHLMRDKDYTQKSQANSERTRALEAREAAIEERTKATDEELDARADLRSISKTLGDYAKLSPQDWTALEAQDPIGAQQHWRTFQLLKDQKAELEGKLGKAEQERTAKSDSDLRTRVQETLTHAAKQNIKPERVGELVQMAGEMGVPDSVIRSNWSPVFLDLLHFASIGKAAVTKQKAAPKPAAEAPPQPLKTVTAKAAPPPRGLSDKLPPDEWHKRFNAEFFGKRRA